LSFFISIGSGFGKDSQPKADPPQAENPPVPTKKRNISYLKFSRLLPLWATFSQPKFHTYLSGIKAHVNESPE
jgi:hypothetical protein